MFNPSRLSLARRRRAMNKIRLAELVGLTSRSITAFESGEKNPAQETLEKFSEVLKFPIGFFYGPDMDMPSPNTASFRSMARMSAAQRDAALGSGAIAFTLNDWIESRFELPETDVLDLREEDPESAAATLRQYWGLGERPVKNMVHLLEAKGIRVFSLAEQAVEVDAFSLWRKERPFVFLNTLKSAEHSRFDAAHELGHLVLHKHGGPQGQDTERQANAFASAFLMPKASVISLAPRMPTVSHLVQLKKQWIVSVAALAYRLQAIGLLTEWHYRSICIEMSERGYRTSEPEGAQRETSQILAKILAAMRQEGVNKSDMADALQIDVTELDKLVFGLAMVGIEGGSHSDSKRPGRADLKVIK